MDDPHLLAAVNELLSMEHVTDTRAWKCLCGSKRFSCTSEVHNENISRCTVQTFKSSNVLMTLSVNSGSFTENLAFDNNVLKSLLKILLDDEISSEDKEQTINLLNKHVQLHPGCCPSLANSYRNLILSPEDEYQSQSILEKVLKDIENTLLRGKSAVLNPRLSRNTRKKKFSEDFYMEDELAPKKRRAAKVEQDFDEVTVIKENNPSFRFAALKFMAKIISHEFHSKCSVSEDKNVLKNTIAGSLFLQFDDSNVRLNEDIICRILELYKHCDDSSNRKPLSKVIKLIANTCLFADSGKLFIDGDITCCKRYPLSQLFCQYFIQSVLKRTSSDESNNVMKNVKPEWLRLICADNALKRSGLAAKGLPSILEKLSAIVEQCCVQDKDASSGISDPESSGKFKIDPKTHDSIFKKRLTEDVSLILMNLIDSLVKTYELRELHRLHEINVTNNITADSGAGDYEIYMREFANYTKFKNIITSIVKIEKAPSHVSVLRIL